MHRSQLFPQFEEALFFANLTRWDSLLNLSVSVLLAPWQDKALVDLRTVAFVLLVSVPRFLSRGVSLLEPEGLLRIVPFSIKKCWVLQLSGDLAMARFSATIL